MINTTLITLYNKHVTKIKKSCIATFLVMLFFVYSNPWDGVQKSQKVPVFLLK